MDNSNVTGFVVLGVLLFVAFCTVGFFVLLIKSRKLKKAYGPLVNLDNKMNHAKKVASEHIAELREECKKYELNNESIKAEIGHQTQRLGLIKQDLMTVSEEHELWLDGVTPPQFDLDVHAAFVLEVKKIRYQQKTMVRDKKAIVCLTEWSVGESKREGKKTIGRIIRLTLRAFNNEADLLISKVTPKNWASTKKRISRLADILNDLNESLHVQLMPDYLLLKLEEVDLVNAEKLKKQEEKERIREQKALEREEAKAQREIRAELRRQELKEQEKENALKSARERLAIASVEHRAALETEISEIEDELSELIIRSGRLLSMAEQTRIGHVYIISNLGSFGEGIVKIGMTRRLEPLDRVKELGDASVPFGFDLHAMIFSEDAPKLEKELHSVFSNYRVNQVNFRKEFFKVTPNQVKIEIERILPNTPFDTSISSIEYFQSQKPNGLI